MFKCRKEIVKHKPTPDSFSRTTLHSCFVFFCGNLSSANTTGGQRRFHELYQAMEQFGYKISLVSRFSDLFSIIGTSRKKKSFVIVFDERYLVYAVILKAFGSEVVFCPRGNKLKHFRYHYSNKRLMLYRIIFQLLYSFCDRVVFQSFAQRDEFGKIGLKAPSTIVPNNINASWMTNLADRNEFPKNPTLMRIGFLGGDKPRKGFFVLNKAYKLIRLEGIDLELIVGGCFDNSREIIEGIKYVGYVSDLKRFYSSVDVIVVPSEYDSFPNVFLEALAARTPVILSDNHITREICAGASSVLFHHDPQDLSRKLLQFYQNAKVYQKIVIDCKLLTQRYSFDWSERMENSIIGEMGYRLRSS